ncbi:MAG: UbiA family prenyltransferase [Williamsia sp.]|nr:UbiA family prenyltransferase [Williamsia sp.]
MNQSPHIYPLYVPRFWRAYFVQMRPYLLFVSGIAGAAGVSMSYDPSPHPFKTIVALGIFFLGYGFGQALTDCFQTDTDKLSAPYRPLSRGIVSIRNVLIVSLSGLLLSGCLFYWFNPVCLGLSLGAVVGLATYSYVKKNIPLGGPFYNAWIVALLPLMGYFVQLSPKIHQFPIHLIPYLLVTLLSYANFVLIGYLKDIEADRATGYKTFPVVFGWRRTVQGGDLLVAVTLACYWWQPGKDWHEISFGIAASIIAVYGQFIAHTTKTKNEQGALVPILATVRSFVLLHIAVVAHFQPGWWPAGILYYSLFEWALRQRPEKFQV